MSKQEITTGDESQIIDGESQEMVESVIQLSAELNLDLTLTKNQRLLTAVHNTNHATKLAVEAGVYLLSVKSECEHGEFLELCEKHDIEPRRAQELMKRAKFIAALPKGKRTKYVDLPKTKMLILSSTGDETLNEILNDDELEDDLLSLSYRELRQRVKQLEGKNADLSVELQTKSEAEKNLKAQLNNRRNDTGLPDYVAVIRHESNAIAEKSLQCSDDFQSLLDDLTHAIETGDRDAEKFNALAAAALLVQARAATARLMSVYSTIDSHLSSIAAIHDGIPAESLFTDAEVNQAIVERGEMIRLHEHEAIIRENERAERKPRGRGAPRKKRTAK